MLLLAAPNLMILNLQLQPVQHLALQLALSLLNLLPLLKKKLLQPRMTHLKMPIGVLVVMIGLVAKMIGAVATIGKLVAGTCD